MIRQAKCPDAKAHMQILYFLFGCTFYRVAAAASSTSLAYVSVCVCVPSEVEKFDK